MFTPAGPEQIWVRVLGATDVEVDGRPVAMSPLQRHLLAALALHAGRPVAAERLVFALWGDHAPRSSANRIQALVSDMRRRLAAVHAPAHLLETTPAGYRLRTDLCTLDLERFAALAEQGHRLLGRELFEAAVTTFTEALALVRGPAFDSARSLLDPELPAVTARLGEDHLTIVEHRVEARLRLGQDAVLVPELTALVEAHPLRERLRGQLMLALHRCGRTADALAAYRAGHALSVDELGTEPGEALRHLHRAILDGRADPAAPRSGPVPSQLPAPPSPFVGRGGELRELDRIRHLGTGVAAVITAVEGAGGVGKTALAVRWARTASPSFPDGQLYLNLHGYSDNALRPVEAVGRLLAGLGVPAASVPPDADAAIALYRTHLSGKRLLLLLDNAENPEQVRSLLPTEPGSLALITSRDRFTGLIASHGAQRVVVDVLPPDEAVALLAAIVGVERVEADRPAAYALAGACSFMPLALRIVAANLLDSPGVALADVLDGLRRGGLDALDVDGDAPMSVRAVLAQSYARLAPPERRLLALLGLVPGPDITLDSASALAGLPGDRTEEALGRLVDAHFLEYDADRYSLHDVVRVFAHEQATGHLPSAERSAALGALFSYYLGRVDAAAALLYPHLLRLVVPPEAAAFATPFADLDLAMGWLEAERANLVAAVRHASAAGPLPMAWQLADALFGYFWIRRHMSDWLLVAASGLGAAEAAGDRRGQISCRIGLGQARRSSGGYEEAGRHFDQAAALAGAEHWPEARPWAMSNRAIVFAELGRLAQAAAGMAASLEIDRRIGRTSGEAVAQLNLGTVHMRMGDFRRGLLEYRAALELYEKLQAPGGVAMTTTNLAHVSRELGLFRQSDEYYAQAMTLTSRLNDRYGEATALGCRALLRMDQRRFDEARRDIDRGVELTREASDPKSEGHLLVAKADILREMGLLDQARVVLDTARDQLESIDDDFGRAEAMVSLALLDAASAAPAQALANAVAAEKHADQHGYRHLRAHARYAAALAHHALGDSASAMRSAVAALGGFRSLGIRLGTARTLRLICRLELTPSLVVSLADEADRLDAEMEVSTR